ncbi:MAG: M28 family peptidase [Clostridiales bacterium]|nr:M28 family peptidase [Clostridiales bacterium]
MKKLSILSILLCVVLAALCLVGCSDYGAPDYSTKNPSYAVSPEALHNELVGFLTDNIDRTTYNDGEKAAADFIENRLREMNCDDVEQVSFEVKVDDAIGKKGKSQNVIARVGATASAKNVIIGTYYDNRYTKPYDGAAYDNGEGVIGGGTSVATLLGIVDYLVKNKSKIASNVCVNIVFFGASYLTDAGASAYLDSMDVAAYKNTVLMIELQRLGVDHVYAFSDARETKREAFFDRVAADSGLDIYKPTSQSPLITGLSALNGVPYYQWAHGGVFNAFFNSGIPTLNLVGANWDSSNLSDLESTKHANLSYSEGDTFRNLKKYHPDYADKMATAATLVIRSVCDKDFLSVMQFDKNNFPDTDALTLSWVWLLVLLAVIVLAAAGMRAVIAYLKKKYPIVVAAPPQMKMAVFGMDYEDRDAADIFIDIHDHSADEQIFEGIENNAPKSDPFGEIFPPPSTGDNGGGQNDDPFDNPPGDDNK